MKNKLMIRIFLLVVCFLILGVLPSFALEKAIKDQVEIELEQRAGSVKNRVKDRVLNKAASAARKGLKWLPGGEAVGDLLFGSEAEEALEIQKEILETNQNTLAQIKAMAQDALTLKRKIEEMDRIRKNTVHLGQAFRKTSYAKMGLALGEKVLGISCNPSDYIPSTVYTQKLKRNLNWKYGREKQAFNRSQRFFKNTRKAFSFKNQHHKNGHSFQKRLAQATAYDRHVEEYASARNFLLAQRHEELADSLLTANKELQAIIHDERAHMSATEVLQTQHIIDKNVSKALFHKAKANSLLKKNSQVSKSDKERLSAVEEHATSQEFISEELKVLQGRKKSNWKVSKQKK